MVWEFEKERILSKNDSGEVCAYAIFKYVDENVVDIKSTFVSPDLRGRGIASKMLFALAEHIRERGLLVKATCSYAVEWFERNKDMYLDIIV